MGKVQQSLFEHNSEQRTETSSLLLVSQPDRPLTPAQRAFNRLVSQVEELRNRLEKETRRLDKALAYYGEHIHPRQKRCTALRKEIVRELAPFLSRNRLRDRGDRRTLREIIAEQLDQILEEDGAIEEIDLRALFERVHGVSYETLEHQEVDEMRSTMESMLAECGIDIDLSDLKAGMSPEQIAAKMAEMSETVRQKMEQNEGASAEHSRRKSKRQLQREERMRQAEEARNRGIASIYKRLAKALHPDLEQDEARRQRKVVLMQELTVAYRQNDLHTLLRLELEWIQREEGNLNRLTEEKLAIYNQVLKEQVFELKQEISELRYHPRYQPIVVIDGPFDLRVRTEGPAEATLLDNVIRDMEASLDFMRNVSAEKAVRAAIREYRAVNRAGREFSPDSDCPF